LYRRMVSRFIYLTLFPEIFIKSSIFSNFTWYVWKLLGIIKYHTVRIFEKWLEPKLAVEEIQGVHWTIISK
jgi:hypothetical protein